MEGLLCLSRCRHLFHAFSIISIRWLARRNLRPQGRSLTPPQSVSQVNGGAVVQISQMWLSDWMAELSRQLPPAHFTQVGVESVDSVKHAGSYHLRTSHR